MIISIDRNRGGTKIRGIFYEELKRTLPYDFGAGGELLI